MSSIYADYIYKDMPLPARLKTMLSICFLHPSKRIVVWHRLSRRFKKRNHRILASLCENRIYHKYHCWISSSSEIGKGIVFPHPLGVVIGEGVKIGENTVVYQHVTIGKVHMESAGYPTVGNNCILYASAKILGDIILADKTVVGANSVLLQSTEKGSIYAGIPAVNKAREKQEFPDAAAKG